VAVPAIATFTETALPVKFTMLMLNVAVTDDGTV
jgi:hypothetical protein